jgi:Protein of unknown function (DUF2752)
MFVYSGFFVDESVAVQCVYKKMLGRECVSCGFTRDFHSFLSLDFSSPLNKYSLFAFLFFFIQMIGRFVLAIINERIDHIHNTTVKIDIVLSVLGFILCFGGLILAQF